MSVMQLPHHPPHPPEPPLEAPVAVAVVRAGAAVQAAAGAAVAVWFGYTAATVPVSADVEDFGEVWQLICAAGCVLATMMTLFVAVPAMLLRRGRSGAWWTLFAMELACAAPLTLALPTLGGHSLALYSTGTAVFALAGIVVVATMVRADARAWGES